MLSSFFCFFFDNNGSLVEGISRLTDHSFLQIIELAVNDTGELRFEMQETIRELALEKLVESGLEKEVRQAHAEYYLPFLKEAQPNLLTTQQMVWLDRLEREHLNLRVALEWNQAGNVIIMTGPSRLYKKNLSPQD